MELSRKKEKIKFDWFSLEQLRMIKSYLKNNLIWAYESFDESTVKVISSMIIEIEKSIKKVTNSQED